MAEVAFNNGQCVQCNPEGIPGTLQIDYPRPKHACETGLSEQFIPIAHWCWAAFCDAAAKPLWIITFDTSTETKILAWMWSWLNSNAQIKSVEETAHPKLKNMIWISQSAQFDLPETVNMIHIDENLPVASHAWYVVFIKECYVPKPVSVFEIESTVRLASKGIDWRIHDPVSPYFWKNISSEVIHHWEIKQSRCTTSQEAAQVIEFIQEQCSLGGHLMCPLDELHRQFDRFFSADEAPWCQKFSSSQWIRHPSVQEALKICGVKIQPHYQNRVWPRGSHQRRHTTFAQGIDLKILYTN